MKILYLEDNPADAELTRALIAQESRDCELVLVSDRAGYVEALRGRSYDAILSDYSLPGFDGMAALALARQLAPDTPFIFFSGSIGEDRAIAALHAGAADYVLKDRVQRLCPVIRRAVHESAERRARRRAEDLLKASQARYLRLIEHARDVVFSLSSTGLITSLNPAFEHLTGWPRARWLDRHFLDLIHPDDRAFATARFEKVVAGASLPPFELRLLGSDDSTLILEITVSLDRDQSGVVEVLGIGRDLTARRHAEELVREQAEVIEQSPAAIVITDLDHRITYCNAGARALYGFPAEEMVGRTADELFPPETMAQLSAGRTACLANDRWQGEVSIVTRDGRRVATEFFMNLIHDKAGRPRARLSVAVDVTEKKQLEEQFLRAQRMENLGLLAAGIAHDFNNILAPVLMISHLLRTRLTAPADQRLVTTLEQSASRGAALVKQILAFAQGTGGERAPLQARHLARDIVGFIESSFPRAITLEHVIPADLWTVRANPTQLHQVLLNLCVNARDAMPEGGTLHFSLANLTLDAAAVAAIPGARPGAFVRLRVADSGTGIPADILPRIWDPFFTTKGKNKGTGLGLSTVRGIVTAHGGFCHAANRPEGGAEFLVFLPAVEGEAAPADVGSSDTLPRGAGETVLVIDDEPAVLETIQAILREHGYRPHTADDGLEAIALLDRLAAPVHVIVTDLNMPRLDAPALIGLLRHLQPGARLLLMSGHSPGEDRAIGLGDAYLPKPFEPAALLLALHRLLRPAAE